MIRVENLSKIFKFSVKSKKKGFIKNLLKPDVKSVKAVNNINFDVEKGESIAFIGPNGAGKSTTIKMLTGILYPTSGKISVAGFSPQKERTKLAYKIGTVFGQRSQLIFNLPVRDSFSLFGAIYDMSELQVKRRVKKLVSILDLNEFIDQPVRKLSLGQRMRAEIAVSLLHNPEIIFLDEPTIGLDVVSKRKLRETLRELNQSEGTTIFLTSHDAGDIESISDRAVFINHGEIVLDSSTQNLKTNVLTHKNIKVKLKKRLRKSEAVLENTEIIDFKGDSILYQIDTNKFDLSKVINEISSRFELLDLDVQNPPLDEVIEAIYTGKAKQNE